VSLLFTRRAWGFRSWFVSTRLTLGVFGATLSRTRFTLTARRLFLTVGRSSFAFFRLLLCSLSLDARFCFFKLLTCVLNVLLIQHTARVAIEVNTRCAGFNTIQVAPARRIKT
jgi:hypothetical protein